MYLLITRNPKNLSLLNEVFHSDNKQPKEHCSEQHLPHNFNLEAVVNFDSFTAAHVIFLGDYCDRSYHTHKVIDFLIASHGRIKRARGRGQRLCLGFLIARTNLPVKRAQTDALPCRLYTTVDDCAQPRAATSRITAASLLEPLRILSFGLIGLLEFYRGSLL
ncbi:hypothetical protein BHE74_00046125 [Ensete ventricosum]|nr:hypothetical protein BHE74_00046125 [Ensete ventricosum]